MKTHHIFLMIMISFVILGSIYTGIIISTQSEKYVLWCVDKNGIEIPIIFRGFDENDINAIDKCRDIMFQPTRYYIELIND